MSHHYVGNNVDAIARALSLDLKKYGDEVIVGRVGKIVELRNVCYDIRFPREVWLSYPIFGQSKLWAYSEVMTEFLGLNPPLTELYTTSQKTIDFMKTFHRDDGRANYTYGERWHNNQAFQRIIKRLEQDRYSRQAVMNIWDSSIDLDSNEPNIPCTIIHQFLIRKDSMAGVDNMHLTVYMRSNDFFKGWKYDTFLNSFILQAFAGFMGCGVGILTFMVGSFHVYESDLSTLKKFNAGEWTRDSKYLEPENKPIEFSLSFSELYDQLWKVKRIEEKSRLRLESCTDEIHELHEYFKSWGAAYVNFNLYKRL